MKPPHLGIQAAETLVHQNVSWKLPQQASTDQGKKGSRKAEEEGDPELHSNSKVRGFSAWKSKAEEQEGDRPVCLTLKSSTS